MAELIASITLSEFKKLNARQIRDLKSVELTADGRYVCTVVVPNTDYIRGLVENAGQLSNSVGGKTLDEVLEVDSAAL